MVSLNSLSDLYLHTLRDIHSAEEQLAAALPRMASAATHAGLREAFEKHLAETREHAARVEQICEALDRSPGGQRCRAMQGLIEEAKEILRAKGEPDVRDAALIGAAQRVEHYEIAAYGCARAYARMLGRDQDVRLLQESLNEEGETDKLLTRLAERVVNRDAFRDYQVEMPVEARADL
jgi:ferritin-like metal-binding protein YciE